VGNLKGKEAVLFVNKKNQKNFECRAWGCGAGTAMPPGQKVFALRPAKLFSRKEALASLSFKSV
jgi:hypothetical protein